MITIEDNIAKVLQDYPGIESVFKQMGMDCKNCSSAKTESLAEGCEIHREDITVLLGRLRAYPGIGEHRTHEDEGATSVDQRDMQKV
jgi:hybrid cluster-associated redox disulfide protein